MTCFAATAFCYLLQSVDQCAMDALLQWQIPKRQKTGKRNKKTIIHKLNMSNERPHAYMRADATSYLLIFITSLHKISTYLINSNTEISAAATYVNAAAFNTLFTPRSSSLRIMPSAIIKSFARELALNSTGNVMT